MIIDMHRWYAVITDSNNRRVVIGSSQDGMVQFRSVEEYEAWKENNP
jgi:hypothetical protein